MAQFRKEERQRIKAKLKEIEADSAFILTYVADLANLAKEDGENFLSEKDKQRFVERVGPVRNQVEKVAQKLRMHKALILSEYNDESSSSSLSSDDSEDETTTLRSVHQRSERGGKEIQREELQAGKALPTHTQQFQAALNLGGKRQQTLGSGKTGQVEFTKAGESDTAPSHAGSQFSHVTPQASQSSEASIVREFSDRHANNELGGYTPVSSMTNAPHFDTRFQFQTTIPNEQSAVSGEQSQLVEELMSKGSDKEKPSYVRVPIDKTVDPSLNTPESHSKASFQETKLGMLGDQQRFMYAPLDEHQREGQRSDMRVTSVVYERESLRGAKLQADDQLILETKENTAVEINIEKERNLTTSLTRTKSEESLTSEHSSLSKHATRSAGSRETPSSTVIRRGKNAPKVLKRRVKSSKGDGTQPKESTARLDKKDIKEASQESKDVAYPAKDSDNISEMGVPNNEQGQATEKIFSRELVLLSANALKTVELERNRVYPVCVMEVYHPSLFWLQLQDSAPALHQLMAEIRDFYEPMSRSHPYFRLRETPKAGILVVARYNRDGQWYRARIHAVWFDMVAGKRFLTCEVLYVDYGNRAREVRMEDIKPLHPRFIDLPAQAFPCTLSKTGPAPGSFWDYERDCSVFARTVLERADVSMSVVGDQTGCPLTFVDIYVPERQPAARQRMGAGVNISELKSVGELLINHPHLQWRAVENTELATVMLDRLDKETYDVTNPALHTVLHEARHHALQQAVIATSGASQEKPSRDVQVHRSINQSASRRISAGAKGIAAPRSRPASTCSQDNSYAASQELSQGTSQTNSQTITHATSINPQSYDQTQSASSRSDPETSTQISELPPQAMSTASQLLPDAPSGASQSMSKETEVAMTLVEKDFENKNKNKSLGVEPSPLQSTDAGFKEQSCPSDGPSTTSPDLRTDKSEAKELNDMEVYSAKEDERPEDTMNQLPVNSPTKHSRNGSHAEKHRPATNSSKTSESTLSSNQSAGDSTSHSTNQVVIQGGNHPTQTVELAEDASFRFLLSYVKSPVEFWVHPVQSDAVATVNRIMTDINDYYSKARVATFSRYYRDDFAAGQLVCARFTEDNKYYRAEILSIKEVYRRRNKSGKKPAKEERRMMADVFYVDFGNTEKVDIRRLVPIPLEHQSTPGQAVKCAMYNTTPKVDETGDKDGVWKPDLVKEFEELVGFEKVMLGYVMNQRAESTRRDVLELVVVDTSGSDDIWLNENLPRLGLAHFEFDDAYYKLQAQKYPEELSANAERDELDEAEALQKWNPMSSDFLAEENSYHIDRDDPGMALTNYNEEELISCEDDRMQQILARIQKPSFVQLWFNRLKDSWITRKARRQRRRRGNRDKLLNQTFHRQFQQHRAHLRALALAERRARIKSLQSLVENDDFLDVSFGEKGSFAEERLAKLLRRKEKLDIPAYGVDHGRQGEILSGTSEAKDENNNPTHNTAFTMATNNNALMDRESSEIIEQIQSVSLLSSDCPQMVSQGLINEGPMPPLPWLSVVGFTPSTMETPSCTDAPNMNRCHEPVVEILPVLPDIHPLVDVSVSSDSTASTHTSVPMATSVGIMAPSSTQTGYLCPSVPAAEPVSITTHQAIVPYNAVQGNAVLRPQQRTPTVISPHPVRFRFRFRPVLYFPYVIRYNKQ